MDSRCNFTASQAPSTSSSAGDKIFTNCSFGSFGNAFEYPKRPSSPEKNTEAAFKMLFYFISAVENILLLYVIYRDPLKRFRSAPTYFICNLMTADLLSITSGFCHSIFQLNPQKSMVDQEVAGCLAAVGVQCAFATATIFAVDRYIAIIYPYKYRDIMAKKIVFTTLLLFPWCFAGIALPIIYFHPVYRYGTALTKLFAGDVIVLTVVSLIVHPLTRWKFNKNLKDLTASSCSNQQIARENLEISKVLATTVLVISICLVTFQLPYLVAFGFILANCTHCLLNHAFQSLWMFYPLITAFRLMASSLIYAWRLPLYRQALKALIFNSRLRSPVTWIHNARVRKSRTVCTEPEGNSEKTAGHTVSTNLSQSNISLAEKNSHNAVSRLSRDLAKDSNKIGVENHTCIKDSFNS